MAEVEADHWWYRGLRDVLVRTIRRFGPGLSENPRILDAGCGTGQNLAALGGWLQPAYLGGFDLSERALELARAKVPQADLYTADICNPQLRETGFDLVVSLDVIYIPGSERSLSGLQQIVAAMHSGGLFIVNLPAYDWLYSEHDVAIHTSERYTATRVRALLEELGLEVELTTYRLCTLFPLVVLSRLPSLLRPRPDGSEARSDLHAVPAEGMNRTLYGVLRAENALIARGVRFPFGSSVYAIGRKT
ncbi:MAG: class I SAM-dependent methyltransferase [Myxococcota bacterium]